MQHNANAQRLAGILALLVREGATPRQYSWLRPHFQSRHPKRPRFSSGNESGVEKRRSDQLSSWRRLYELFPAFQGRSRCLEHYLLGNINRLNPSRFSSAAPGYSSLAVANPNPLSAADRRDKRWKGGNALHAMARSGPGQRWRRPRSGITQALRQY
jgi:hypothetical protein